MTLNFVWKILKISLFVIGFYLLGYGIFSLVWQMGVEGGCIFSGLAAIMVSILMLDKNGDSESQKNNKDTV